MTKRSHARRWTSPPPQTMDPAGLIMRVFLIPLVIVAAAGLVAAAVFPAVAGAGRAVKLSEGLFLGDPNQQFDLGQFALRSTIYARDDSVLAQVADLNRIEVSSLDEVGDNAKNAVLAIEDHDFYQHGPIDIRSILRALIRNAVAGEVVQGGSTITQQLAKNLVTGTEQTFQRKWDEAKAAVVLERQFTKDEILMLYLNYVYFGNGVYGIATAAEWYFAKKPANLTVAQAALLAGLIKAPVAYDPVTHKESALARRDIVIDKMFEFGFIDQDQHDTAKNTPLVLKAGRRNVNKEGSDPYYVQYVKDTFLHPDSYFDHKDPQYKKFLKTFGNTYDERFAGLFQGGLKIYTTLDRKIQNAAKDAVESHLPNPGGQPPENPEAAVITLVPQTGAIRAMYGGDVFQKSKFNLATQSVRTAGSSFKAFTLAAAFEQGVPVGKVYNATSPVRIPASLCPDPSGVWSPSNADPAEGGYMDLATATADSVNAYFAQLIADIGPQSVVDAAERMGVISYARDTTVSIPAVCSITLGAVGVNPLSMTSGYSTLANEGTHCHPFAISKIVSATGEVLYKARPYCKDAIEKDVADQVTGLLRGVVQYGTGTAAQLGSRPVAGKTGTGQEYQDAWFIGYVPQLTTGVWVGYSKAEIPMRDLPVLGYRNAFGGTIAAPIFHDVMEAATAGMPIKQFPAPPPGRSGPVPDVVGMKQDEAEKTLGDANFTPKVEMKDSAEPEGTVFAQEPKGGTVKPLGSLVTISVSNGKAPKVVVPDVVMLARDDAVATLEGAGFVVKIVEQIVDDPHLDGLVLSQTPEGGANRRPGATVTIIVGVKNEPTPTPSPSPSP
jgi:penicillin-binding protein 1A